MNERDLETRLNNIEIALENISKAIGVSAAVSNSATQSETNIASENAKENTVDQIDRLLSDIALRKSQTKDVSYTTYLDSMRDTLLKEQKRIGEMAENLEKNHQIYLATQKKQEKLDALGNTENVVVAAELEDTAETLVSEAMENTANEAVAESFEEQGMLAGGFEAGEPVIITDSKIETGISSSKNTPKPAADPKPLFDKKKSDMEFGIGAVALSVIGAVFIILALVLFGVNYMDNLSQGILMYVIGAVVLLFSEFVVRRHLERFAHTVSGIGICVLYTATIVNYLYLHTLGAVMAIVLTLVVSGFTLWYSRKKDSAAMRIIGILGCYVSLLPIPSEIEQMQLVISVVMLIIVNIMYLSLPLRSYKKAVPIAHSIANMVATGYLLIIVKISDITIWPMVAFIAAMLLINTLISVRTEEENSSLAVSIFCRIVLAIQMMLALWGQDLYWLGAVICGVICGATFYLEKDRKEKYILLYCFTAILPLLAAEESETTFLIMTAVLLALYKMFSWKEELRFADAIVSAVAALVFLCSVDSDTNLQYVLLAVFVLSVVTMKNLQQYHEIVLLTVLEGFALIGFETEIAVPLMSVFLLLCLALFGMIPYFYEKGKMVFLVFASVCGGVILLGTTAITGVLPMTILFAVETAILCLLFTNKYGFGVSNSKQKLPFALAIYLTYMIFVFDIELPIVTSVLLMLLAIACVAVGFVVKTKGVRVYGLCLSLFVCVKIMLLDFHDADTSDKMILSFVVGVLAIGISYLYMRIERNMQQK